MRFIKIHKMQSFQIIMVYQLEYALMNPLENCCE